MFVGVRYLENNRGIMSASAGFREFAQSLARLPRMIVLDVGECTVRYRSLHEVDARMSASTYVHFTSCVTLRDHPFFCRLHNMAVLGGHSCVVPF